MKTKNDGKVAVLIDQITRCYAREAARLAGMTLSDWIDRAIMRAIAQEAADRAAAWWKARGEP